MSYVLELPTHPDILGAHVVQICAKGVSDAPVIDLSSNITSKTLSRHHSKTSGENDVSNSSIQKPKMTCSRSENAGTMPPRSIEMQDVSQERSFIDDTQPCPVSTQHSPFSWTDESASSDCPRKLSTPGLKRKLKKTRHFYEPKKPKLTIVPRCTCAGCRFENAVLSVLSVLDPFTAGSNPNALMPMRTAEKCTAVRNKKSVRFRERVKELRYDVVMGKVFEKVKRELGNMAGKTLGRLSRKRITAKRLRDGKKRRLPMQEKKRIYRS